MYFFTRSGAKSKSKPPTRHTSVAPKMSMGAGYIPPHYAPMGYPSQVYTDIMGNPLTPRTSIPGTPVPQNVTLPRQSVMSGVYDPQQGMF